MLRLGEERGFVNVIYDQVGTPTCAEDLARAVLTIVSRDDKNNRKKNSGIYHYSNEGVASWYDFAKTIFEFSGMDCKVNPVLSDEFHSSVQRPHFSVLNKSKIKTTFNLEIPYWRESLKQFLKKL
jgi:dTDP-4-dehydrorhamnose reductase